MMGGRVGVGASCLARATGARGALPGDGRRGENDRGVGTS